MANLKFILKFIFVVKFSYLEEVLNWNSDLIIYAIPLVLFRNPQEISLFRNANLRMISKLENSKNKHAHRRARLNAL